MNGVMLDEFCHGLMEDGAPRGKLLPADLAREFVDFFGVSAFPRLEEVVALLDRAGVGTAVGSHLPDGFRGIHTGTKNGRYLIKYDDSDWNGAQEHTLLHEAYEIVRERLHDLYPRVARPAGKRLCQQADRFAAATLMQPEMFSPFAESSGFDVVALQRIYGRAYSSLTVRLAEVMRHQPLLAALYERKEEGDPDSWSTSASPEVFRATVVARTPGFRLRMRRRPLSSLRGLLPRRGAPPARGSVAERVALTSRPVYVARVSGYDLWRADDVTVAAWPVNWHGRLAKISVVVVPYRDRSVLLPQLAQASFERVPKAHQVI